MEERYYHTPESVLEYIQAAKGFDGKRNIETLKDVLPTDSTLLELGSGPGSDFEILNKRYSVTGSDYSNAFILHLKNKYPNEQFLQLNAATLESNQQFDGIYSNKVLHHLTNDEIADSIERQHEILNTNGIICHSFWMGEGSEIFKGMFVNYHNESELRTYFSRKFEILLLQVYAEFEENDSILLLARKRG